MTIPSVAHTADFHRIAALPRRVWRSEDLAELADELTNILGIPNPAPCPPKHGAGQAARRDRLVAQGLCPMCEVPLHLRPAQAAGLYEAGTERGLFAPLGVGEGKTLLSLLLPLVLGAVRPLLLLPAGLIEKTQRERLALSRHWRIPTSLRVFSYDMLGRVQSVDELETYAPDLFICDEVHRLKNLRAAVTRRVARYMVDHIDTLFCGLSGSVIDKSIKDCAHLIRWCLKLRSPVPLMNEELEEWAEALDNGIDPYARRKAGALLDFCTPAERSELPEPVAARRGFQRRLVETPGVVATVGEGEHVGCSIYVRGIQHRVSAVTEANFLKLRKEWATPDDWLLMSGVDVWRHAQELALGLHYVWDPRPPDDWREARKAWHKFVRETIARSRTYDSEQHVAMACDAGLLPSSALQRWRELAPTFTPNVVPLWHDSSALEACRDWMKTPGLVWTEHGFFAERLAHFTGAPYYGAGGFTETGAYIEDHKQGTSAIASIDANREGKNIQGIFSRNLLVCPPKSAAWCEQVIGRTHRTGQLADEVIVDVLLGCRENYDNITDAIDQARAIQDTTGKVQKLLLADVVLPAAYEIDSMRSPRWTR